MSPLAIQGLVDLVASSPRSWLEGITLSISAEGPWPSRMLKAWFPSSLWGTAELSVLVCAGTLVAW